MKARSNKSATKNSQPTKAMQLSLAHHHLDRVKQDLDQKNRNAAFKSADDALLATAEIKPPQHALMIKLAQSAIDLASKEFSVQYLSLLQCAIQVADPSHEVYRKNITKLYLNLVPGQIVLDKKSDAVNSAEQALANATMIELADSDSDLLSALQLAVDAFVKIKLFDIAERLFICMFELSFVESNAQLWKKASPELINRLTKPNVIEKDVKHDTKAASNSKPSEAMQLSLAHYHLDQVKQHLDQKNRNAAFKSADDALLATAEIKPPQHALMIKLDQRAIDLASKEFSVQYLSLLQRAIQVADPSHEVYRKNITKLYLNLVPGQIVLDKKADAVNSAEQALANATMIELADSDSDLLSALRLAINNFVKIELFDIAERLFVCMFELSATESRSSPKALSVFNKEINLDPKILNLMGESLAKNSDLKESIQYFLRAATQGHSPAMHNLGISYLEGRGVEKNTSEGVEWLIRSLADRPNSQKSAQQLERLMSQASKELVARIEVELGILALEQQDVARGFRYIVKYPPTHLSTEQNLLIGLFIYSHFIDYFSILDNLIHNRLSRLFSSIDTRQTNLFYLACQHLTHAEEKSPEAKRLLENIKNSHTEVNHALGFKTEQPYRVYHEFNTLNFHFFKNESNKKAEKNKEQEASINIIKTIMGYCGK